MANPFISMIEAFGFNFAPRGWALCAGQTLPINQNQALFALLGTTFGGNGQTTFNLPDLRGRLALGFGQGAGLSSYNLGAAGGEEAPPAKRCRRPIKRSRHAAPYRGDPARTARRWHEVHRDRDPRRRRGR
jgi:microcystin-dependent protein